MSKKDFKFVDRLKISKAGLLESAEMLREHNNNLSVAFARFKEQGERIFGIEGFADEWKDAQRQAAQDSRQRLLEAD